LGVLQTWTVISVSSHNGAAVSEKTWRIPVIGGVPADQRLLATVPALVEAVIAALLDRVPTYRRLPREQVRGELTRITEGRIRSFAQAVRTGEPVPAAEFDAVRDAAARRAEEGLPLDAVLLAHHLGLQICWDLVAGQAREGDTADLLTLNRLLLDHLRQVTAAAGAGYFEERRTMADEHHAARHTLLTALLDGGPAEEAATRAGLRLPPCYAVLVLAVAEHPDERADGVDRTVAGHRKLRRLRAELDHHTRQSALSLLSAGGGPVLVPLECRPGEIPTADWDRIAEAVARAGHAAGVPVLAGAAAAEPGGVAAAAALARELLDVAQAFGRPAGLHRLDDLLLEYQLTRPSQARPRLASLIEPLDPGGELLTTLRTHLAGGLNRRHTARALHLHPNTVDYRLRRIAALTGLDPARPADLLRITAAIAAHDAERA
jgi:hypothetical protein